MVVYIAVGNRLVTEDVLADAAELVLVAAGVMEPVKIYVKITVDQNAEEGVLVIVDLDVALDALVDVAVHARIPQNKNGGNKIWQQ